MIAIDGADGNAEGNWHLLYRTFRANVYKMKKNRANRLVNWSQLVGPFRQPTNKLVAGKSSQLIN